MTNQVETICRVFPTQVCFADGLAIGITQPGAVENKSPYGPPASMSYSDRVLRSYSGQFADIAAGSAKYKRIESFFEQCQPIDGRFWIKEVISAEHRNLRCHERGDGTKTTFIVPVCSGGSVDAVFVNDVPLAAADYTVVSTANLISDDNRCNGDGDSATVHADITSPSSDPISVSRTLPDIGYTSFVVTPAAAKTDVEIMSEGVSATVAKDYTAGASILAEPGNYDLIHNWYNGITPLAASTNNTVVTAAGWIHLTATETAPLTTTLCYVSVKRKHSSGTPMYVGAFQLSDDDNENLFLPNSAPMMVTFDTAPADKAEIAFSVTGNRMTKCKIGQKSVALKQYDLGHVLPGKISAVEVRQ